MVFSYLNFKFILKLEVVGGPQPMPELNFHVNDSSVASISENGLITSIQRGNASIRVALSSESSLSNVCFCFIRTSFSFTFLN